jgi:PAS domain S-box-containing protein
MAGRRPGFGRGDISLLSLSLLTAAGIFGLDLLVPLGVAAGVPYVAVVLLGAWLPWRHSITGLAAVGTALTVLGYFFSPAAGIAWVVLTNRGLALLVIWVTAILMLQRRASEEGLKDARDDLEVRVAERSSELENVNVDLERQIAERVQAEERSQLLLQSAGEGIYGIDMDGNCTFCNAACIRLLGYHSEHQLLGKDMHALIHHTRADGTDYPAEECRIYQAVRRREGCQVDDEVFWRADGKSFPAEYRSNPIIPTVLIIDSYRRHPKAFG